MYRPLAPVQHSVPHLPSTASYGLTASSSMRCSAYPFRPLRHLLLARRSGLLSSFPTRGTITTVRPLGLGFYSWSRTGLRPCSNMSGNDDADLSEFTDYMEKLRNYERVGVPKGAGTDSSDGFDLGRMRRLLSRLGDPHLDYKAVHIAGTKGKGSTAAFLSNILREEGYSVGCYTSPHLLTIRERISLGKNGNPVESTTLVGLLNKVKDIIDRSMELESGMLTHFEVLTALAFKLFSEEKVDIAIIEAGLGGARDATNVLTSSNLAAAVITTIGEEHLDALGGSLESIAMAKAGIIKEGCPLVLGGPFERHIEDIIWQKALLMNAPVLSASDPRISYSVKEIGNNDGRPYQSCDVHVKLDEDFRMSVELVDVKLFMIGEHQLQNALTAICTSLCLRKQGWRLSDGSIRTGIENTTLPGRSQFLTYRELETLGLSGVSVLIDGAHTKASAKRLADIIREVSSNEMLALVVAMASDKDHVAFSRQLLSGVMPDIVLLTEVNIAGSKSRITPASILKDYWLRASVDAGVDLFDLGMITHSKTIDNQFVFPTDSKRLVLIGCETECIVDCVKAANQLIKSRSVGKRGLIVVTGSLHIVASVLSALQM